MIRYVYFQLGVNMYIILRKDGTDREVFSIENSQHAADQYDTNSFEITSWNIDISGTPPKITRKGDILSGEILNNKVVTEEDHKIRDDDIVVFFNSATGITINTEYYVVNSTSSSFQISDTEGGDAKDISSDAPVRFQKQAKKYIESRPYDKRRETEYRHKSDYLHKIYRCVLDHEGNASSEKSAWENKTKEIKDANLKPWTDCTVDATTDIITCNDHGFADDELVEFSADTFPGGIVEEVKYYIFHIDENTFKITPTETGSVIDLTSNGTNVTFRKRY